MSDRSNLPKAGFFQAHSRDTWVWKGNELFDETGKVIAVVRSDVLYVAEERMLIESTPGPLKFRCRATTADGQVYTITQDSFTVAEISARCADREYLLRRSSPWRKTRVIETQGNEVAVVRPMTSGQVEIELGTAGDELLPMVDAVFLSWGCVLVDSPVRRPRV